MIMEVSLEDQLCHGVFEAVVAAPPLEVAEIFRRYGGEYRRQRAASLSLQQERVLRELQLCRTAALGGHINVCKTCGKKSPAYNSCRNRHCPKCQHSARTSWKREREREALPVQYHHVVLTLPDELAQLSLGNERVVYGLLCQAAGQAILEVGRKWSGLQAEMGLVLILHSWGQLLNRHPHVHCIVPGGGLSLDGQRWVSLPQGMFLPNQWLADEFRDRYLRLLQRAYDHGKLYLVGQSAWLNDPQAFAAWCEKLSRRRWITHAKPVELQQGESDAHAAERVVQYLARYASGTAMSNQRLLSLVDGQVKFTYKDYRDGARRKVASLPAVEFIDRFLSHVLPQGMRHVRHYGFLTLTKRTERLETIRALLAAQQQEQGLVPRGEGSGGERQTHEEHQAVCPHCGNKTLVCGPEIPRPTVAEIMQMPWAPTHTQQLLPLKFPP